MAPWAIFGLLLLAQSLATSAEDIHWINSAGGNWHVATNWDIGRVPGYDDDVIIDTRGSYTINIFRETFASSVEVVNQRELNSNETIVLRVYSSSTTLDVQHSLVADDLVLERYSTIHVREGAEIYGTFHWHGGNINGDHSTHYIFHGDVVASVFNYPYANINGPSVFLQKSGRLLGGNIYITQGGELIVSESAVVNLENQLNIYEGTGAGYVYNYGHIEVRSDNQLTRLQARFFMSGSLHLFTGQMLLTLSTISGNIAFEEGTQLLLQGSGSFNHYFHEQATTSGPVEIVCSSGKTVIDSHRISLQTIYMSSSCNLEVSEKAGVMGPIESVRMTGPVQFRLAVSSNVEIQYLKISERASCEITSAASIHRLEQDKYTHNNNYYYSKLILGNNTRITDMWTYRGGDVEVTGETTIEAGCLWTGSDNKRFLRGQINIAQTCEWEQTGATYLAAQSELFLRTGSSVEVKSSFTLSGDGRIENYGTFLVKLVPPSIFTIDDIQFINHGQLHMDSAPPSTFNLAGDLVNAGTVKVFERNTIRFQAGATYNDFEPGFIEVLKGSVLVAGGAVRPLIVTTDASIKLESGELTLSHSDVTGHIEITGGTLNIDKGVDALQYKSLVLTGGELYLIGHLSLGSFTMSGGVVNGPGSLIIEDNWEWTRGTISNSQIGTITVKGTLNLQTEEPKILGKHLTLLGDSTWLDVGIVMYIVNKFTVGPGVTLKIISNAVQFSSSGVLENNGNINITLLDGYCITDVVLDNHASFWIDGGQLILRNSVVHRQGSRITLGASSELVILNSAQSLSSEFVETRNGSLKISNSDVTIQNAIGVSDVLIHRAVLNLNHIQGVTYNSLVVSNTPIRHETFGSSAIRLAGANSRIQGRVEVWYRGRWGTICDDGFDANAAKVVCRQLGLSGGAVRYNWRYGTGPIRIRYPRCTGNENHIGECPGVDWTDQSRYCGHHEDVGVLCDTGGSVIYPNYDYSETTVTFASVASGGWTHEITTLNVEDAAMLRFNAPSRIGDLFLSNRATIENNNNMVVNGRLEWLSGTFAGVSVQGTVRVTGEAAFLQQEESVLSRQTMILENTGKIAWITYLEIKQAAVLDISESARISVVAHTGGIYQWTPLAGSVYVRGRLDVSGKLIVAADFFLEGSIHVNDRASLLFNECRNDQAGRDYRGTVSRTINNYECQRWDSQTPHGHTTKDEEIADGSLREAANFCRNPSGGNDPWCYTTNRYRRLEACAIPYCGTVHISGELHTYGSGFFTFGSPTTFSPAASFTGRDLQFQSGNHELRGSSTTRSLVVSGGNLAVYEGSAIVGVQEFVMETGGVCTIECREITCQGLQIPKLTVAGGSFEINRDVSIDQLHISGGQFKSHVSAAVENLTFEGGVFECTAGQRISLTSVKFSSTDMITIRNCLIEVQDVLEIIAGSTLQLENTIVVLASQNTVTKMHSNTRIECTNSRLENKGQWKIFNLFNITTQDVFLSCPTINDGLVDIYGTNLHIEAGFLHKGVLNADDKSKLTVTGHLSVETSANLNISDEIHFSSDRLDLNAFRGFIRKLVCESNCALDDFSRDQVEQIDVISGETLVSGVEGIIPKLHIKDGILRFRGEMQVEVLEVTGGQVFVHETLGVANLIWMGGTLAGSGELSATYVDLKHGFSQVVNDINLVLMGPLIWDADFPHKVTLQGTAKVINNIGNNIDCHGILEITGDDQEFINSGSMSVKESGTLTLNTRTSNTGCITASEEKSSLVFKGHVENYGTIQVHQTMTLRVSSFTANPSSETNAGLELYVEGDAKIFSSSFQATSLRINSGATLLNVPQDRSNFRIESIYVSGDGNIQISGDGQDIFPLQQISIQGGSLYLRQEVLARNILLNGGTVDVVAPSLFKHFDFKMGTLRSGIARTNITVEECVLYDFGTKTISSIEMTVDSYIHWHDPSNRLDEITVDNNAHIILLSGSSVHLINERQIRSSSGGELTNKGTISFESSVDNFLNIEVDLTNEGTLNFGHLDTFISSGYITSQTPLVLKSTGDIQLFGNSKGDPLSLSCSHLYVKSSEVDIMDTSQFEKLTIEDEGSLIIHHRSLITFHISKADVHGSIFFSVNVSITTMTLDGSMIGLQGNRYGVEFDQITLDGATTFISTDVTVRRSLYVSANNIHLSQSTFESRGAAQFVSSTQINFDSGSIYRIPLGSNHVFEDDVTIGITDNSYGQLIIEGNLTIMQDFTSTASTMQKGNIHLVGRRSTVRIHQINATSPIEGTYKTTTGRNRVVFTGPGESSLSDDSVLVQSASLVVQGGVLHLNTPALFLQSKLVIDGGTLIIGNTESTRTHPFDSISITDNGGTLTMTGLIAISELTTHNGVISGDNIMIQNLTSFSATIMTTFMHASSMFIHGNTQFESGNFEVGERLILREGIDISIENGGTFEVTNAAEMEFMGDNSIPTSTSGTLVNNGVIKFTSNMIYNIYTNMSNSVGSHLTQQAASSVTFHARNSFDGRLVLMAHAVLVFGSGSQSSFASQAVVTGVSAEWDIKSGAVVTSAVADMDVDKIILAGGLIQTENSCHGFMEIDGGSLQLRKDHSISRLELKSGWMITASTTAVNGPAILRSGNLTTDHGATLYFNGQVMKDSSVIESSSGTISYVDPGDNCLTTTSCSACTGQCAWHALSLTCVAMTRQGVATCSSTTCSAGCDTIHDDKMCTATQACQWCSLSGCVSNTNSCPVPSSNHYVWTNIQGGSWHSGANWDKGSVPDENGTAIINIAGDFSVQISSPTTVKSIILGTDCSSNLCSSKPTLQITTRLTVGQNLIINHAATMAMRSYNIFLTVDGYFENKGTVATEDRWTLSGMGTLINSGRFVTGSIRSTRDFYINVNVTNTGLMSTLTETYFLRYTLCSTCILNNQVSGMVIFGSNSAISGGHLNNTGTFVVVGSSTHSMSTRITNHGEMRVNEGTLSQTSTIDNYGSILVHATMETRGFLSSSAESVVNAKKIVFRQGYHNINEGHFVSNILDIKSSAILDLGIPIGCETLLLSAGTLNLHTSSTINSLQVVSSAGTITGNNNTMYVNDLVINSYSYINFYLNSVNVMVADFFQLTESNNINLRLGVNTNITTEELSETRIGRTANLYLQDSSTCLFSSRGSIRIGGTLNMYVPTVMTGKVVVSGSGTYRLSSNSELSGGSILVTKSATLRFEGSQSTHTVSGGTTLQIDGHIVVASLVTLTDVSITKPVAKLTADGGSSQITIEGDVVDITHINNLVLQNFGRVTIAESSIQTDIYIDNVEIRHGYLTINRNTTIHKLDAIYNTYFYLHENYTYTVTQQFNVNQNTYIQGTDREKCVLRIYGRMKALAYLQVTNAKISIMMLSSGNYLYLRDGGMLHIDSSGYMQAGGNIQRGGSGEPAVINKGYLKIRQGTNILVQTDVENFGTLYIGGILRLDRDSYNEGQVFLSEDAELYLYSGSHNFQGHSAVQSANGSTLRVGLNAQVTLNGTNSLPDDFLVEGILNLHSELATTHIARLVISSRYNNRGFYFHGNEFNCDVLEVRDGVFDTSTSTTKAGVLHLSSTSYLRGYSILVLREMAIVASRNIYVGTNLTISEGASCSSTYSNNMYLESGSPASFSNNGRFVVGAGVTQNIFVPFHSSGELLLAGNIDFHNSHEQMFHGTIHMVTGGNINVRSGQLEVTSNATWSGQCTINMYSGSATVYAKANNPETRLDLVVLRGSHTAKIDTDSPPVVHIYGRGDYRYQRGALAVSCSGNTCAAATVDLENYVDVSVETANRVDVDLIKLNGDSSLRGHGVVQGQTMEWIQGTLSNEASVMITGVSTISSQAHSILESNMTTLGPVHAYGSPCTKLSFRDASMWIRSQSTVITENCLEFDSLDTNKIAQVQNDGNIALPVSGARFVSEADFINHGTIVANENTLTFHKLINNGHIHHPSTIAYNGQQSVFSNISTFELNTDEATLVINNNAEVTCERNNFPFTLDGISGKFTVPDEIRWYAAKAKITSGFTLEVGGSAEIDELFLQGGQIQGRGTLYVKKLYWTEGTVAISSMTCSDNCEVSSTSDKTISGSHLSFDGNSTLYDGTRISLGAESTLSVTATMYLLSDVTIISDDQTSSVANTGDIFLQGGFLLAAARLHCAIQNNGNITVTGGHAELGWNDFQSSYNGTVMVLPETQLTFTGGQHTFHMDCEFTAHGLVRVNNENVNILVEDGESSLAMTHVTVTAGLLHIQRAYMEPVEYIKTTGGIVISESPISVSTVHISYGEVKVRSAMQIDTLFLEWGTLSSDSRLSQVGINSTYFTAGYITATDGKHITVGTKELTVTSGSVKALEGSVDFIVMDSATFASRIPISLSSGAQLTVSNTATFVVIGGEVVESTQTDSNFVNEGRVEIGLLDAISSSASFGSPVQNNGQMLIKNVHVTFSNGGDLGAAGVVVSRGSSVHVTGGSLTIADETFEDPTSIAVSGGSLLLSPGFYNESHVITVSSGQVILAIDEDGIEVEFPGEIILRGGTLSVIGEAEFSGVLTLYAGTISGDGMLVIGEEGRLTVTFSDSASDTRTIVTSLLDCHGTCEIQSPVSISSGGVLKISENTVLELQAYSTITGGGQLLNMGTINVDVIESFRSQISTNVDNYWLIKTTNGQLFLSTSQNSINLHETSQLSGQDIILGTGVRIGGVLDGSISVDGNVEISEPTFITGTVIWISGGISTSRDSCNYNYGPPNSVVIPQCMGKFLLVQGTMIIQNGGFDKTLADNTRLVNEGTLRWQSGKLRVGQTTIVNNGHFIVNSSGEQLRWEKTLSYRYNFLVNTGSFNIHSPSVTMETTMTSTGQVSVCQNCHLSISSFTQSMDTASLTGESSMFFGTVSINGGTLDWSGTIDGNLNINSAKLTTNGPITVDGTMNLANDPYTELNIYNANLYDNITVTGSITFAGRLVIDWNGYTPVSGSTFTIITWSGRDYGLFGEVASSNSIPISAVYNSDNLQIEVD